jgi:hypothetical protein
MPLSPVHILAAYSYDHSINALVSLISYGLQAKAMYIFYIVACYMEGPFISAQLNPNKNITCRAEITTGC